jgi:hypothetical protein
MRADNTNIYWDVSADGLAWHPFATAPVLPAIATMGRSWDFNGYSGNHDRIGVQNQTLTGLAPINPPGGGSYGVGTFYMSDTTPPWTPCVARVADTGLGGFAATHANVTGTLRPMAPGWTSLSFATPTSTAPQSWTATDGTNTAWRTNTAITTPQLVYGYTNTDASTPNFPVGSIFAIFVNGVEVARTYVTVATSVLEVRTEIPFAINDVLSLRYYNPTGSNINMVDSIQAGPGTRRPYLRVTGRMAETAGDYWICPTTGTYNLHAEICNGASFGFGYMITVNRKPLASVTIPYIISNTVADYSVQTMDANSVALTAGDMVGLGALMSDYNSGWLNRVDGAEGTAKPYLRATRVVPSAIISNDSWMVNFSQGGPAGSPDAFVDHVNVPPVDQSYSYGGYGDGPYGSPPPVWEPLQGPAGPSGDPDLGLYRPVSGRLTYPANWSEYGQPFGNSNVYRDRQGVCHLNTTIAGPASFAAGSTCCYLPIGFFPLNRVMLPGLIGNPQTGCRIDVNNTDGSIQVNSTTPAGETFVALDLVWFSAVPYLAVLDGLVVTSVVFQSGSSYLVTYTAGHLVNLAGVVTAIPAGSASVVASGVTWFCLIITAAGGVGQSYGNNSEASSCVGYYASSGNPANGALLATFSTGAGVRPVNDRRWLPYV